MIGRAAVDLLARHERLRVIKFTATPTKVTIGFPGGISHVIQHNANPWCRGMPDIHIKIAAFKRVEVVQLAKTLQKHQALLDRLRTYFHNNRQLMERYTTGGT